MYEDLKTFLAVVDSGSFTAAARVVFRTQPAISAAMFRLEEELGASLLLREARGSRPTAAGVALVPHARAVVAAVADGIRAVHEVVGLTAGEVRIGAGATACAEYLPPFLSAFHREFPGVTVRLREEHDDTLREQLKQGKVDIAVLTERDVPASSIVEEAWMDDALTLVQSPAAMSDEVVTFWHGSAIRELLMEALPSAVIAMELGSVSAVRAHVLQGIGMGLLSLASVGPDVRAGRLVVVKRDGFPVQRRLVICHHGVDRLSPAAAALRIRLLGAGTVR
ncbi:MAG: DNA-binding transcriptional LysR family regulator [Myxococcota bacterium]|jgi:DNA-binding transcriptional LysR family regulator